MRSFTRRWYRQKLNLHVRMIGKQEFGPETNCDFTFDAK